MGLFFIIWILVILIALYFEIIDKSKPSPGFFDVIGFLCWTGLLIFWLSYFISSTVCSSAQREYRNVETMSLQTLPGSDKYIQLDSSKWGPVYMFQPRNGAVMLIPAKQCEVKGDVFPTVTKQYPFLVNENTKLFFGLGDEEQYKYLLYVPEEIDND